MKEIAFVLPIVTAGAATDPGNVRRPKMLDGK
jgi:hypothetical protein